MKELLYIEDEEWLAQSLKIKKIRNNLSSLEDLKRELALRGERDITLDRKVYRMRHYLKVNISYLESIQLKIDNEYNLRAMEFVSYGCLDEDFYSKSFERDGFIRGFKL